MAQGTRKETIELTDTLAVLAASWGVLMAASPLLQIRRMLERRSSGDLSVSYLSVLLVGFVLWVAYGTSLGNAAIVIPNAVALVVGLATVLVALRFRDPVR
jgi:MtN3 and saliva related transmembrane protein